MAKKSIITELNKQRELQTELRETRETMLYDMASTPYEIMDIDCRIQTVDKKIKDLREML